MQSKEKDLLDARTFVAICNESDPRLVSALKTNIVSDLSITSRTAYNWMTGANKPISYLQKKGLVKTIKRTLGITTTPETLFA